MTDNSLSSDVLDVAGFERLTGDPGLLPLLAAAFLKQWPDWHPRLLASCQTLDRAALKLQLHRFRGSCGMLSAPRAVAAIERAEAALPSADDASLRALLDLAVHALEELASVLQTHPAAR